MVDEDRIERLERLVEQQRDTIATLQEQVATLADDGSAISADGDEPANSSTTDRAPSDYFSRRSILGAAAALGLGGYATGSASAAEPRGVAGSTDHPVDTLYLDALSGPITDGADLTTLAGGGLSIDDGSLATTTTGPSVAEYGDVVAENPSKLSFEDNVDVVDRDDEIEINVSDSNSQTDVSDDGTTVVESTGDVDFGDNLAVSDDGDGSATVDADVEAATNWEDAGSNLLTTSSPFEGIDVEDVSTNSLDGGISNGTNVTDIEGDGLSVSLGSLGLTDDSVTVAGNVVSLGESTGVSHGDLSGLDQIAGGGLITLGDELAVADTITSSEIDPSNVRLEVQGGVTVEASGASALQADGSLDPAVDDSYQIGNGSSRWTDVYATNGVSTSSDARLKRSVSGLSNAVDRLDALRPVSYEWIDAEDPDTRLGFIAQELQDAVPEAVTEPEDEEGFLSVNYDMMIPVAVGAIQAQRERIEHLEARLDAVEDGLSTDGTSRAVADD